MYCTSISLKYSVHVCIVYIEWRKVNIIITVTHYTDSMLKSSFNQQHQQMLYTHTHTHSEYTIETRVHC